MEDVWGKEVENTVLDDALSSILTEVLTGDETTDDKLVET